MIECKQRSAHYDSPHIVGQVESQQYGIEPGTIIVICVGIALFLLLGAMGVCLLFGYDGIAYTINTNNASATLACYKN